MGQCIAINSVPHVTLFVGYQADSVRPGRILLRRCEYMTSFLGGNSPLFKNKHCGSIFLNFFHSPSFWVIKIKWFRRGCLKPIFCSIATSKRQRTELAWLPRRETILSHRVLWRFLWPQTRNKMAFLSSIEVLHLYQEVNSKTEIQVCTWPSQTNSQFNVIAKA